MSAPATGDNRRVALIKSLATNNRFYVLIEPERGIRNADTVEDIPDDLLLGIAYPCLEDGLNDFAVIRTTFETLDLFPEDDPIREEMMGIINDARDNLRRRLSELQQKIAQGKAHFLGTDYAEFKSIALEMAHRGYSRRNLDSMMKLNVFVSVAEAEGQTDAALLDYVFEYRYVDRAELVQTPPAKFIVSLFTEIMSSVDDGEHYKNKYLFDRNVFQKFIAVMFVNYATTNPLFYGINRSDYGISAEKAMDATPLYLAIGRELREIEARLKAPVSASEEAAAGAPESVATPDRLTALQPAGEMLPGDLVNEEVVLGRIASLCSAAAVLSRKSDPETQRFARLILAEASKLVTELKQLGIVSAFATDPSGASDCR